MNEEGGTTIDVAAQQTQAFVGGIPGFHHNVVELIAQEVFDHALMLGFHLEEVSEYAGGSESTLELSGLEEAANGFGGVTVFGDDGRQRSFLAEGGSVLGA